MIDPESVLVVTAQNVPGYQISAMLGTVFGSTTRSAHGPISALSSSLNPVSQGELVHLTKAGDSALSEAVSRLKTAAAELGANAVVALQFSNYTVSELAIATYAYGTAVVLTQ